MKLLIVESPNKVASIEKYLGPGWKVAASVGHIRDLPVDEMGVEPPDFKPKYVPTERGRKRIAELKRLADAADEVYLATDPDREGEAISWHLKDALKLKDPKRVTFNSITPEVVRAGVAAPRKIDVHLVAAQEARRILDRLVGYIVSPVLSSQSGISGLSAGRVQSPALRILVERERAIKNFKPTKHFGARLHFDGKWTADWLAKLLLGKDEEYFLDEAFATKVAALRQVTVASFTEGKSKRSPPGPFTTSTMLQAASAALGMNPGTTMQVAQKLFEKGYITYHRTDNPNLDAEAYDKLVAYGKASGIAIVTTQRRFKSKEGAQEGHEACRPAYFEKEGLGDSTEEKALYALIRNRAIASQMPDAEYATRSAVLVANDAVDGKEIKFEARGRTLLSSGWLSLTSGDQTEEGTEAEPNNPIPALTKGQVLTALKGELMNKITKPPPRFTEAALTRELENRGIGRPSTYAAILMNITTRGYIKTEKKFIVPTDLAYLIVDALTGNFAFIDFDFTRDMEEDLDDIAQGKGAYKALVSSAWDQLQKEQATLSLNVTPKHACPKCSKALRRIKGKNGFFWGCTGYPTCNTTFPDNKGKPDTSATSPEDSPHKCPDCGKGLRRVKGKNGFFWSCSGYPDCRTALPDVKGKPGEKRAASSAPAAADPNHKCKECGKPLVHRVKEGAGGFNFWGCSGYPKCKKTYKDDGGKPKYE